MTRTFLTELNVQADIIYETKVLETSRNMIAYQNLSPSAEIWPANYGTKGLHSGRICEDRRRKLLTMYRSVRHSTEKKKQVWQGHLCLLSNTTCREVCAWRPVWAFSTTHGLIDKPHQHFQTQSMICVSMVMNKHGAISSGRCIK